MMFNDDNHPFMPMRGMHHMTAGPFGGHMVVRVQDYEDDDDNDDDDVFELINHGRSTSQARRHHHHARSTSNLNSSSRSSANDVIDLTNDDEIDIGNSYNHSNSNTILGSSYSRYTSNGRSTPRNTSSNSRLLFSSLLTFDFKHLNFLLLNNNSVRPLLLPLRLLQVQIH